MVIRRPPRATRLRRVTCSLLSFLAFLFCYVLSFSILVYLISASMLLSLLDSFDIVLSPTPQTRQTTTNLPGSYFSGMPAKHSKYCIYAISAPYTTPWGIKWLQTEPRGLQHHQKTSQNDPSKAPWHRFLHALAKTCACQENINVYNV